MLSAFATILFFGIVPAITLTVFLTIYDEKRFRRICALWVCITYVASLCVVEVLARGRGLALFIILTGYIVQACGPVLHIALIKQLGDSLRDGLLLFLLVSLLTALILVLMAFAGLMVR